MVPKVQELQQLLLDDAHDAFINFSRNLNELMLMNV